MPQFLYEFNDLLQGVIKHLIRVLNRILYSRCCATYRRNTWHGSPGKIWFQMLRNALQRPCFCKWEDDICERPGLKWTNSIWRPHFNVVETLRSITIVRSVCGLQTGCSFWQLKPRKGTLKVKVLYTVIYSKKRSFICIWYWSTGRCALTAVTLTMWQVLRVTASIENPAYAG